jgi:diaminopimelate decarboxylase
MDDFDYRHGELHCGSIPVSSIADRFGTPTYVYSAATLLDHHRKLARAFAALKPLICYSVKSSGNINLCRLLAQEGAGMDVVSGGELHRAMAAGCPAEPCRAWVCSMWRARPSSRSSPRLRRGCGAVVSPHSA